MEWSTNDDVAGAEWDRCMNISSATAAGGKTSRKRFRRRWERPLDGERADAGKCTSAKYKMVRKS
jgi:hypothetical protein